MVSLIVGLSVVAVVEIALVIWIISLSRDWSDIKTDVLHNKSLIDLHYEQFLALVNSCSSLKEENEKLRQHIDEIERLLNEPVVDGDITVNDIQMKDVDASLYGAKKADEEVLEETFIVEETD